MRGLWLWLCTFPSFPNLALFVFICQFQGFLFGAVLVHALHRETTGVLNGSPQCGLDFRLYLGVGYCKGLCEGVLFYFFVGKCRPW